MELFQCYFVFAIFIEVVLSSYKNYSSVQSYLDAKGIVLQPVVYYFNPCDHDDGRGNIDCQDQNSTDIDIPKPEPRRPESEKYSVLINGPYGICTGTLISEKHVLTAAHCFVPQDSCLPIHQVELNPANYSVFANGTCRSQPDNPCSANHTEAQKYNVTEVCLLDEFFGKCRTGDLAILTLSIPDEQEDDLEYAELDCDGPNPTEDKYSVSGWGYDPIHPENTGNRMMTVDLTAVPCADPHYDHICVEEINTDACEGDSGAGFFEYSTIVGVVSYGARCNTLYQKSLMRLKDPKLAAARTNGVITSVHKHMGFICSILENNRDCDDRDTDDEGMSCFSSD